MSIGTPRYTVRINPDQMTRIEAEILSHNTHSPGEPWDLSEFLRQAIREFLRKKKASRNRKPYRSKKAQLDQV